jgi:hemin uptake protein HemP
MNTPHEWPPLNPPVPTNAALLERLRRIVETPGLLNPCQKVIWRHTGVPQNKVYTSPVCV